MSHCCLLAPGHKVKHSVLTAHVSRSNPNLLLLRKSWAVTSPPSKDKLSFTSPRDSCQSCMLQHALLANFLINRFCKRNFMNLLLPNLHCASATHHSKPQSVSEPCWGGGGSQQQLWMRLMRLSHCLPSLTGSTSTRISPELHRPFSLPADPGAAVGAGMHNGLKTWALKKGGFTFPGLLSP